LIETVETPLNAIKTIAHVRESLINTPFKPGSPNFNAGKSLFKGFVGVLHSRLHRYSHLVPK